METPIVASLRDLRSRADVLNISLVSDLKAFLRSDGQTFRRIPTEPPEKINVASSCTGLMALALARELPRVYPAPGTSSSIHDAFERVVSAPWISSGLDDNNAFTTALVLQAAGVLASKGSVGAASSLPMDHSGKSLGQRADEIASAPLKLLVVQVYPITPTIVYWYIDGIDNLGIALGKDAWAEVARWAQHTFAHQISLLVAGHDAMMDPVEMGMAACLCNRLRAVAGRPDFEWRDQILSALPSSLELVAGIRKLFEYQADSGIWPKYFPMFHYPDAGANYTFSFELLEAILKEYSHEILADDKTFAGFTKAVAWCEQNRLEYFYEHQKYLGWNSGGQLKTLSVGMPESWATAVVHTFLAKLRERLSESIQGYLIPAYALRGDLGAFQDSKMWDRLIDTPVKLRGTNTSLKVVLKADILDPLSSSRPDEPQIKTARSALLFGPPGTSKTTLVRAIAAYLGWQYLEITPSHFLRDGLNNIYTRANEIFDDLQDLSRVVVLFDEMDALVQSRVAGGAVKLDVTREFLTTSMLPKLAELHRSARLLFFMATNHQIAFDDAIKRPGRFDLLLHVAPPQWAAKIEAIDNLSLSEGGVEDYAAVRSAFTRWTKNEQALIKLLDLFTVLEIKSLLNVFRGTGSLTEAIGQDGAQARFRDEVERQAKFMTLREDGKESPRAEFDVDIDSSIRQI